MSTAISKLQSSTALSTDVADAIAAAAQEEGTNELGTLLKYAQGIFTKKTEEVPLGTEYIAHIQQWVRGWVKFKAGCLVEHRVGKVADGFVVPEREELDETDQATWEKSPSGEVKDPWSKQSYLPLENIESGEIVTFVSGSGGGRQAVSTLCSKAARHITTMGLPVIELGTEKYKNKRYGGYTDKPVFTIVRWTNEAGEPAPAKSMAKEMDDVIPF
jgi:hypothetical protein